ncbi:MAG: hypothetical protein QNJ23_10665 [Woeseiaceae bacterium]|nr:hypothetical protein [Woeseiaceae bacterium]
MKFFKLMLVVLSAGIFTGCATIVSDSSYPLAVNSSPHGAYFTVTDRDGIEVNRGTTPQTVELKAGAGYFKGQTYTIVLSKEGFEDQTVSVRSSMDGWYWGNIVLGGLLGMLVVDPITGAMYRLPESVAVNMDGTPVIEAEPEDEAVTNNTPDLDIIFASVDELSEEQRALLQPVE